LVFPPIMFKMPVPKLRRIGIAFEEFDQYVLEVIKRKKESNEGEGNDLLNLLLKANRSEEPSKALSDREVIGDTFIFLFGGHETTANTLCFALGLLALYPRVQQKVFEETSAILSDPFPQYEEYKKLVYTMWVFKETLRLFPPAVEIPKIAVNEAQVGDFTIPAKTFVNVHLYCLHRNPQYWTEPNEFIPERFDPKGPGIVPGSYYPFSSGPRNCIGKYFSQVEGVIALGMIVKYFNIEVPPGITKEQLLEGVPHPSLKPSNGMKLILKKRPNTRNFNCT